MAQNQKSNPSGINQKAFLGESIRKGVPSEYRKDFFYLLMEMTWPRLFGGIFILYILSNVFFAAIYMLLPYSISGLRSPHFWEAYFFSIQTMSTIGYGSLHPTSFASNVVVSVEAAFGLIGIATVTGIVFSKLSRPQAKILFSKNLLDTKMDGKRTLQFRIGNTRGNDIVDAKLTLSVLLDHMTAEGQDMRRIHELKLLRDRTPFFRLTWSVFHVIDETSPLFGMDLHEGSLRTIVATVAGHDGTYSNTIYSRYNYFPDDIIQNRYFADIMEVLPDGNLMIDYEKFHDLKS
ncbi:MAG: ion channel [Bdellovibrionota bacterium]